MTERKEPWCCYPGCPNNADWSIWHEDGSNYTESCTAHVGELLTDAAEHRVYPVPKPDVLGAPD